MCEKVMCDDGIEREIVSRKEAKERGLVRYFTGKACKHGHIAERYVISRACVGCNELKREKRPKEVVPGTESAYNDEGELLPITNVEFARQNGEDFYFTGVTCKNGHLSVRRVNGNSCVACEKEQYLRNHEENKQRRKEWRRNNKDYSREYSREWRKKNPEKAKAYLDKYKESNKELMKERQRKRFQENKEEIYEKRRNRRNNDPLTKTSGMCRDMLQRTLRQTKRKKGNQTYETIGYDGEILRGHIEKLFLDGMSWENSGEWHIDHLKPVNYFIQKGIKDPSVINALDNLAPMWAGHNREKGDKTLEEYLEDRPDLVPLYGRLLEK